MRTGRTTLDGRRAGEPARPLPELETSSPRWLLTTLACVLIGGAALLALAALEFALRITMPEQVAATADHEYLEPSSTVGYSLSANVEAKFRRSAANGGQMIRWSTNSAGYRGPELREPAPLRVVVYGDSNVQAVFSRLEDTFPKQLETRLAAALDRAVEVVNAGVVGHGPDHYLLRFDAEFSRLQPDAVVFNIFADNDLGDPIRHRLLEARSGTLNRRPDRFVYPPLSLRERLQRFASSLVLVKVASYAVGRISPQNATTTRTANAEANERAAYIAQLESLVETARQQYASRVPEYSRVDHYDIDVATRPSSASAREKIGLLRSILETAQTRARSFGVPLLVSIQPSRVDLVRGAPLDFLDLQRFGEYRPDNLTNTVASLCRDAGVEAVNLYATFAKMDPSRLYFREGDNHWNDEGQRVAAEAVAARLLELLEAQIQSHGG